MSIKIKNISYKKTKDIRILETVLANWFNNPKELNLIEPRMSYPFNFKKWVELSYKESNIESFSWKNDMWIIGLGNIRFNENTQKAHAFHIFTDPKYRNQGLATKMLEHLESLAKNKNMEALTINVVPKNNSAKALYEKIGFKNIKSSKKKWEKMEKIIA
ncbi:MAG: GNAT family N-acetyltransferase [Fidelibacterota bacterium]|jgi:ribosomal protein S18 acetylase RimI-like enzyme|tara:strand:- start:1253 stop:1732 length:480 start_codon:yes stop_codon:yes gene_type:complete